MTLLRQGDVLLIPVDEVPRRAVRVPAVEHGGRRCLVVAHGERTGHAHTLPAEPGITLFRDEGGAGDSGGFLEVAIASVKLHHEEHRALRIRAGRYRIVTQRQYDPTRSGGLPVAD
ncbi:MAG: hypothetical protein ACREJ5_17290 [Geminicoccaceae bacterium]